MQGLGKGAKKAVVDEAWRLKAVEDRIGYSLVKVRGREGGGEGEGAREGGRGRG